LTDGKLSAKGEKGGQATLQLYVDPGSSERMLKVDAKDSEGLTYSAELKRTGTLPSQNDDQVKTAATAAKEGDSGLPSQGHRKEHHVRRRY
jgi:hypothetical protein